MTGPYRWYQSVDSATTMVNHSTKNSKSNQKQNQISNEEQQPVQMSSESGNVSRTRFGLYGVQSDLNRMNSNSEGVLAELNRMNTKMEMMIGCFYRMTHDRGKELDHGFNGDFCGFRELDDVDNREVVYDGEIGVQDQIEESNGGIESNFRRIESSFDLTTNQIWCSIPGFTSDRNRETPTAMESGDRDLVITIGDVQYPITEEVLHQIFNSFGSFEIIDLFSLKNGDVQAHIGFRCSSSAAWEKLSLQGRCIYTGCCQMEIEFYKQQQGGMNPIVTDFHRVIEKPKDQLSGCEVNSLENYYESSVFGVDMVEVEMEEKLVETGDVLVDEDHVNAISIVTAKPNIERGDESYNTENVVVKMSEDDGACFIPTIDIGEGQQCLELGVQNLGKEEPKEEHSIEKDNKEYFWKIIQGNWPFELQVDISDLASNGNASNGWQCGAANGNYGIKVGAGGSFVASNRNEEIAGEKVSTNGLLQVIFYDPFYDAIKSVLVNDKRHLLLAVKIAISMVEGKGWLALECEVCRLVLRSQNMGAAVGIGAQWLRRGVG